ncbi:MAG TPA: riboflavin synthase [Burkholderiales bacterium]|nr:riboflavin synthase [Burkholderiales bacterium]
MFSGIVASIGKIESSSELEKGIRLVIDSGGLDLSDVAIGDSIAVSGVCLTVVKKEGNAFYVDVSGETLRCTQGLEKGREVNLEKALRLSDRLGGHLVSGHVDGVGEVVVFEKIGESMHLAIRFPKSLSKFIAAKGSITVNGVSLTVNEVDGDVFHINLIPHTLVMTNLKDIHPGGLVNLEVDMLARYVERLLNQ